MIRLLDLTFSFLGLIVSAPMLAVVYAISWFDTGSPLFRQERLGRHQQRFTLVKFRTMHVDAPTVATHQASASHISSIGSFLRRSKLDELPQLWNVLIGEMSLVGPRPCLSIQTDVVAEREKRGVFEVRPGITGLAQIRGVDMSRPELLATLDAEMICKLNFGAYCRYLFQTALGGGVGDRIRY